MHPYNHKLYHFYYRIQESPKCMLMYEITACQQSEVDMIRSSDTEQVKFYLQLTYYVTTTYKVYMTKTQSPKHQH
jgi:hypothetical protein